MEQKTKTFSILIIKKEVVTNEYDFDSEASKCYASFYVVKRIK